MYCRFRENESTLFETALESKKQKLRRKTPKRKTPNAVKARGAHGALRAQRPTLNIEFRHMRRNSGDGLPSGPFF